MVEGAVVETVKCYLDYLRNHDLPICFGVVFGSRVTGQVHEWSDIDLIVVSPIFDGERHRVDVDNLWIKASEIDPRIEPIPCGEVQWREDDSSAILEIARREGQIVGSEQDGSPARKNLDSHLFP